MFLVRSGSVLFKCIFTCFKFGKGELFAYWVILHAFLSSTDFFFKINFQGIPSKCQTV